MREAQVGHARLLCRVWQPTRACLRSPACRPCAAVAPMLRVVPLFETLDDLEYAETAMRQLFANPWYAQHIKSQGAQVRGGVLCCRFVWWLDCEVLFRAKTTMSKQVTAC